MELLMMIGYFFNLIIMLFGKIVKGIIYGIVGVIMTLKKCINSK